MSRRRPTAIEELFRFLRKNHRHNKKLQEEFIWQMVGSSRTARQKAIMLLDRTVHTQSQPSLSRLATFFRTLEGASEPSGPPVVRTQLQRNALRCLDRFTKFVVAGYKVDVAGKYDASLFCGLRQQPGWGSKTAALLVRNLALIARSKKLRQGFWPDISGMQQAEIFLPVDAVIFEVFAALKQHEHLAVADPLNTFDKINTYLKQELGYSNEEMLCWDDLWFWGFINQRSSAGSKARKWGWNPDKYWSIPHLPKSPKAIAAIERASEEFRRCIGVESKRQGKRPTRPSSAGQRAAA